MVVLYCTTPAGIASDLLVQVRDAFLRSLARFFVTS
jgi:hypothetical protein